VGYNKILGGGFANFLGSLRQCAVAFTPDTIASAQSGPFAGGSSNPLNYPAHRIDLAMAKGALRKSRSSFPRAAGNSILASRLTSATVEGPSEFHHQRRHPLQPRHPAAGDSDLPAVAALNQFQAGLGDPVRQPNKNIGGSLGFAWIPGRIGKTIVRAGSGIYYENGVFNNILLTGRDACLRDCLTKSRRSALRKAC